MMTGLSQYVQPRHSQANQRTFSSCSLPLGLMKP